MKMNAAFYKVGERWINVQRINFIERTGADPEGPLDAYTVHFCGGDVTKISNTEAKKLAEFLKQNQAEHFHK